MENTCILINIMKYKVKIFQKFNFKKNNNNKNKFMNK